jgi:hypothetical protein
MIERCDGQGIADASTELGFGTSGRMCTKIKRGEDAAWL